MLGRGAECDIALDDEDVSREHCRITPGADGFVLEDLGSRNGTIVNGEQIRGPVLLRPGDLIVIGHSLFEVASPARPPASPRPAGTTGQRGRTAPAVRPATTSRLASAASEAALAGQRVQRDLAILAENLQAGERAGPEALAALATPFYEGEAAARRVLRLCQHAAEAPGAASIGALAAEASAAYASVTCALQLCERLREARGR